MAIQGFLTAFDKIDTDHDHIIHTEDLERYARDYDMPESFTKKWISLFDEKRTGQFTYEHFCEVIGLGKSTPMSPSPAAQKDLKLYKCKMDDRTKNEVSGIINGSWNLTDSSGSMHDLLMNLDDKYGPRWCSRPFTDEKAIPVVDPVKNFEMAFSPDGGNNKYIIWKQKKGGGCCACF